MKKLILILSTITLFSSCKKEEIPINTQTYSISEVTINDTTYNKVEGIINENLSIDKNQNWLLIWRCFCGRRNFSFYRGRYYSLR